VDSPRNWPEDFGDWFELAQEIRDEVIRIVQTTDIRYTKAHGLNDPVIYAATLLFRTLQSFKVTSSLAKEGDVVEANTIARSCIENVLWLRGLHAKGMDFVEEILNDGMSAEAQLAKVVLAVPGAPLDEEYAEVAKQQIRNNPQSRISTGKITDSQPASIDYAVFRMISNSYAHPSLQSLDRHVVETNGNFGLTVEPLSRPQDALWAMFVAGGSVLTAAGLFLETFPVAEHVRFNSLGHGKTLQVLSSRLSQLGRDVGLAGEDAIPGSDKPV
jgi:hypothetical protein